MSISPILRPRILVMFALALILSVSAYGFAASNSIAATAKLGDGSQAITGYTVDNINYTLDASTDPSTISAVAFNLTGTPVAASVRVQLVAGGTVYSSDGVSPACTIGAATLGVAPVTCTVSSVDAVTVDTLHVVASSNPLN
jgi:hypothetical protein